MSRNEPSWRRYLAFWRPAVDRDVDAEIGFHMDERVADLMARGRTEVEAHAEAELEFGDREVWRDRMREIDRRVEARRHRGQWLGALGADLRLTLRSMRRAPAISVTVVGLLGLGIGANSAIFSMLDRMFLRPPPGVADPAGIRRLWGDYKAPPPMHGFVSPAFNYPGMSNMARGIGTDARLAAFEHDDVRMGAAESSPMLRVTAVVGDYFGVLRVRPALGRFFAPEELEVTAPHKVAVLSHRTWSRVFAGDSSIVGKSIRLAQDDYTVIGVAAAGFDGIDLDAVDVWRPANYMSTGTRQPWYQARNGGFLQIIGRLRPGVDETDLLRRANLAYHEGGDRFDSRTTLLLGPIVMARGPDSKDREQKMAVGLAAVTLIVLLIAVANVGNLLLTRAIERRREIAVRIALGVSRRRLAAQMLTESAVLAAAAGMAATLVGMWGALLLRGLLMPATRWADRPLDLRLVAFTFGVALVAGLAAGILPFLQTRSLDLASSMRGTARDGTGYRSRARASLIIAQAALSVILLTGAALFLRSLQAVRALDIGFDADHTIVGRILAGDRAVPAAERSSALAEVRERVASLPGVRAAGLANMPPMWGFSSERLFIPGRDSVPQTSAGPPTYLAVSPEYFAAAGVSIVRGRAITDDDGPGAPRVAVVTRTMARVIWGEATAVGQCMRIEKPDAPCTTIVGIMEDLRRGYVIEAPTLQFYLPLKQRGAGLAGAVVVAADPARIPDLERELQALIRQAVPGGIAEVNTLADRLEPQYRPWRVGARLFMAFGALALLVASIGIYSAISYAVTRRSHELGVRMALGARRAQVARLVIGSGVRVVASGVVIGVVASLLLSGPVGSMLYGTDPRDPAVLAGVAAILLGVAVLAAALPAWRATRLDPVRALRAE